MTKRLLPPFPWGVDLNIQQIFSDDPNSFVVGYKYHDKDRDRKVTFAPSRITGQMSFLKAIWKAWGHFYLWWGEFEDVKNRVWFTAWDPARSLVNGHAQNETAVQFIRESPADIEIDDSRTCPDCGAIIKDGGSCFYCEIEAATQADEERLNQEILTLVRQEWEQEMDPDSLEYIIYEWADMLGCHSDKIKQVLEKMVFTPQFREGSDSDG